MIRPGDPLNLPASTGVRVLARDPFRAAGAMDRHGVIRRKPPVALERPDTGYEQADLLMQHNEIETTDVFGLEIPDGILVGERAVVTNHDEYLITDSTHSQHTTRIFEEEGRRRFEHVHLETEGKGYRFSHDALPHVQLDDEVIALTAMEQGNYGAFLIRLLPKLILVRQLGLLDRPMIAPSAGWQGRVLAALGLDLDRITNYDHQRTYRCRKLIVPSLRTSEFFADDSTRSFFSDIADRLTRQQRHLPRPERVYVSRITQGIKHPNHRFFMNEAALIEKLKSRGFLIFEPEAHSFEEQVHVFASARIVVGPGGAGMFNSVFCRPGTTIISIEPMLTWFVLHANMFASMGHHYAMVVGGADESDPSEQKRWRADIGRVEAVVDKLLALS